MKKLILFTLLLVAATGFAQTTTPYTPGTLATTCNAVAATGDCTSQFDLAAFGGTTPSLSWTVTTTGVPTGVTVWLEGSIDGTNWGKLAIIAQTDSEWNTTITNGEFASIVNKTARYLRGSVQTLSGGTSPSVTVKFFATH